MSRLDSAIRRLMAQRACLEAAAVLARPLPGPAVELGLGNGRTFDHLRSILSGREIFVFEREVRAHPDCIPDGDHLFLGDLTETLPGAATRLGGSVALLHSDIGTGDREQTRVLVARIAPGLVRLLRPGAIVVSDQPLPADLLETVALPPEVEEGRYFLYRMARNTPAVRSG